VNRSRRPWVLAVDELAAHLGSGGAALFPTDTLPALAVHPEAAGVLWRLKARPAQKPLILMGADLAQLQRALGQPWRESWLRQARSGWPGALTLVLPFAGPLAEALHPGGASLGLRVPACARARELLRRSGPLATTSANRSGEPPARDAGEAGRLFPELPCLGPLPWPPGSGQASTVIAWEPGAAGGGAGSGAADREGWRVLRAGAMIRAQGGGEACSG
jgi:L-threonylcarbamoyladenylate synthase